MVLLILGLMVFSISFAQETNIVAPANVRVFDTPNDGVVAHKIRHDRSEILRNLSRKKRRKFYEENLGRISKVLFENDVENGHMSGFTENYIRVKAKYNSLLVNVVKKVRLKEINENGGVNISEPEEVVIVS